MCKCRGCSFCAHEVERRATAVTAPALAPPSTLTTQLAQKLAKPAPVPCSSTVAGDTDVEASYTSPRGCQQAAPLPKRSLSLGLQAVLQARERQEPLRRVQVQRLRLLQQRLS